jgi:tRNA(adenine34) deaminase
MQEALHEAKLAFDAGEIPIGAVIVRQDQIIARAHNTRQQSRNPLHHAEIIVLEEAAKQIGDWRLNDCTLYVTLEPCPMCLGALFQARVGKLFFGCHDDKRDVTTFKNDLHRIFPNLKDTSELSSNNHSLAISGGILEIQCSKILKDFFASKRK